MRITHSHLWTSPWESWQEQSILQNWMQTQDSGKSSCQKAQNPSQPLSHLGVITYCFNVLPYGIRSGSKKFQKSMSRILEGLKGVECNIEEVLAHAPNQELHDSRLKEVLECLSAAGVTLNLDKCTFTVLKIKFMGNTVSAEVIEVDPDKVAAVVNLSTPKNVHEVCVFLGMVNHMGKFAENLANKTKPIRDLMQKDRQWVWEPPQQTAFEEIKSTLTTAPVLALCDTNRETKISADASSFGMGGVLLQKQDDQTWRPVTIISQALIPVECRYLCANRERGVSSPLGMFERVIEY